MSAVERIDQYLSRHRPSTPCVIVDLETVRQRCAVLCTLLPTTHVYYAVKANPASAVISALSNQGIGVDLASAGEIDRCLELGVSTDRFCFGSTIKRESDIVRARALGIDLYALIPITKPVVRARYEFAEEPVEPLSAIVGGFLRDRRAAG